MARIDLGIVSAAVSTLVIAGCSLPAAKPYSYSDVSDTMRIGCDCIEMVSHPTGAKRSPTLRPPVLLYPPNRSVFSHYPREIDYRWEPAAETPRDAQYLFQYDFVSGNDEQFGDWSQSKLPIHAYLTGKTTLNERFVGDQPGRWRVKTLHKTDESDWSEWHYFRFTR